MAGMHLETCWLGCSSRFSWLRPSRRVFRRTSTFLSASSSVSLLHLDCRDITHTMRSPVVTFSLLYCLSLFV